MRKALWLILVLCSGAASAQNTPSPAISALNCKPICEGGANNLLSTAADKAQYAACWMKNYCTNECGGVPCNPVAVEHPPSGNPMDILNRALREEGKV
jgi:hypothetical protein